MRTKVIKNLFLLLFIITIILTVNNFSACGTNSDFYVENSIELSQAFEIINSGESGKTYTIHISSNVKSSNMNYVLNKENTQVYLDVQNNQIIGSNVDGAFISVENGELILIDSGEGKSLIKADFTKDSGRMVIHVGENGSLVIRDAVKIMISDNSAYSGIAVCADGEIVINDCYIDSKASTALKLSSTSKGYIYSGYFSGYTPIFIENNSEISIYNCVTYSYDIMASKPHIYSNQPVVNFLHEKSEIFNMNNDPIYISDTDKRITASDDCIFIIGQRYNIPTLDGEKFLTSDNLGTYIETTDGKHSIDIYTDKPGYWEGCYLDLEIKKELAVKYSDGTVGQFKATDEFQNYNLSCDEESTFRFIYSLSYYRGEKFLHKVTNEAAIIIYPKSVIETHADEDNNGKCDICGKIVRLGKPENLTATQSISSVTLSWKKVEGATGYRVFQAVNGRWKSVINSTRNTNAMIQNLSNGTKYSFAVRAYLNDGTQIIWAPEYSIIGTATKAIAPENITTISNSSAIKLTWTNCDSASGYRVYYRYSTKHSWTIGVAALSGTSCMFKNLSSATALQFAVRPYIKTSSGIVWSTYTSVFSCTTPEVPIAKVISPAKGKITLSWNEVSGATGYQIYYKSSTSGWRLYKTISKPTVFKFNARSGITYSYAVKSYKTFASHTYKSSYNAVSVTAK